MKICCFTGLLCMFFSGLPGDIALISLNQKEISADSTKSLLVKAKFIKNLHREYCGYVHIPEKNLFEIISFEREGLIRKTIQVEYYTGCKGSNFVIGSSYSIYAIKISGSNSFRNIKTTPVFNSFLTDK